MRPIEARHDRRPPPANGGRFPVEVSYALGMLQALRVLAREKLFASFAILTLALGIGAVLSVVDGVLLNPLAYANPGNLHAASIPGKSNASPASAALFCSRRLSI